jgi:hypothetical protein
VTSLRSSLLGVFAAASLAVTGCDAAAHATRPRGDTAPARPTPARTPPAAQHHRKSGTTKPTRATAAPVVPRRTPTRANPLRVLLVGDSVAGSFAPGLERALTPWGARFRDRSFPGFGLTSTSPGFLSDGTPWPSRFEEWPSVVDSTVRTFDPDVVFAYVGDWDQIDRVALGRRIKAFSPEWRQWYHDVLDLYVRHLTARGAHVYWVLLTKDVRPEQQRINDAVNREFLALEARVPDRVTTVSIDRAIVPNGPFVQQMHLPDGRTIDVWKLLHFTSEGADLVGNELVHDLGATWGLAG